MLGENQRRLLKVFDLRLAMVSVHTIIPTEVYLHPILSRTAETSNPEASSTTMYLPPGRTLAKFNI
jgi:hypothetical protein